MIRSRWLRLAGRLALVAVFLGAGLWWLRGPVTLGSGSRDWLATEAAKWSQLDHRLSSAGEAALPTGVSPREVVELAVTWRVERRALAAEVEPRTPVLLAAVAGGDPGACAKAGELLGAFGALRVPVVVALVRDLRAHESIVHLVYRHGWDRLPPAWRWPVLAPAPNSFRSATATPVPVAGPSGGTRAGPTRLYAQANLQAPWHVRRIAARQALTGLIQRAQNAGDQAVVRAAIHGLVEALEGPDPWVSWDAASLLGQFRPGAAETTAALAKAARDPRHAPLLRSLCLKRLVEQEPSAPATLAVLADWLRDPNPYARDQAIHLLAVVGRPAAEAASARFVRGLTGLVRADPVPAVRACAYAALVAQDPEAARACPTPRVSPERLAQFHADTPGEWTYSQPSPAVLRSVPR